MTHTHNNPLYKIHTQQAVHCDDMNARMLEFSHTAWHQKRLALNYVQPQMVPPVTKVTAAPPLYSDSCYSLRYPTKHDSASHYSASHYSLDYWVHYSPLSHSYVQFFSSVFLSLFASYLCSPSNNINSYSPPVATLPVCSIIFYLLFFLPTCLSIYLPAYI